MARKAAMAVVNRQRGGIAVFTRPEVLQRGGGLRRLIDAEPEKRLAPEDYHRATLPGVQQQPGHQRLKAPLHRHWPGLVAHRFVRHGVEPEDAGAGGHRLVKRRRGRLFVQAQPAPVQAGAQQLAATADKRQLVRHFRAPRVAAKDA